MTHWPATRMTAVLYPLLRSFVLAALITAPAAAQRTQSGAPALAPAATTTRANAGSIGVISGGVQGTYIRIAADLATTLDDGDQLRILPIIGRGSVQNIADVLYLRGVDVGIVQGDVLTYLRRERMFPGIEQSIQYITKLYDEEVHLLARADISSIEDLAHQPVNVDLPGSGTAMTASVVFDTLGIPAQLVHYNQAAALDRLKRGEIAALVYVTGKPAALFSSISPDAHLHFLPIAITPGLLETYLPSQLEHDRYPALIPDGAPVETLAVGAVMAVYAWPQKQERYTKVARFVKAFFTKFNRFREPPNHPKWADVNLAAQLPGWTRFPAAQEELQRDFPAPTGTASR